jgi:hypothetical protein
MMNGEIFGKNIDASELVKKWPGDLGRATIIDTKDLSENEEKIFTQTMMSYLNRAVKEQLLNEIAIVVTSSDKVLFGDKMKQIILSLESRGFGFVLSGTQTMSEEIEETLSAKMTVIGENDVAIATRGKPSYRVVLRPTLSGTATYQ